MPSDTDQVIRVKVGLFYHRGAKHIGISFAYDADMLRRVRQLPGSRYSGTRRCWYIPNNDESWAAFLRADIPHTIVHQFDNTVRTFTNSDNDDIASPPVVIRQPAPPSEGTQRDSGIKVTQTKKTDADLASLNIEWNNRYFLVRLVYRKDHVAYLKALHGTWWNSKYGQWVVSASFENLEKLQSYFHYWEEDLYQRLEQLMRLRENPIILELYTSPEFTDYFMVKLRGFGADYDFLRHLSDRSYDKDRKIWKLPLRQNLIDRILQYYKLKGAKIVNRLAAKDAKEYHKQKPGISDWNKYFLRKVPKPYHEIMEEYMATLIRQNYSKSSVQSYTSAMIKYVHFLQGKPISKSTAEDVNHYLDSYADQPRSESFYNTIISAIKFYYEKVIFLPDFELDRIERPRKGKTLPTILSRGEVEKMLHCTKNLKHISMLYAIYSSGLRLSELLGLRLQDIHWDRDQILVKGGKGNKDRMVMLSQVLKEVMRMYVDQYKPVYWLFEGADQKHQYSDRSVQQVVRRAAKEAGILRKVTPHTLRHCFATHLLDGGTDIRYIQDLLGHKDIKTTLVYTHVTTRRISEITSPLDQLNLKNREDEKPKE
ncbi:MAG: tyrosine-type recombinase/integrase [Saprospiraceae bacterium]|nr:tyrosine-type recombinase/integrase [Saprospiraceae bacterium]